MSKKPKADGRKNPEYDEPQSVYVEGVDPDELLKQLLESSIRQVKKSKDKAED